MEHQHRKKLYRSSTNKILGGVCGGLAEYINVDTSVIRLIWTVVVVFTGIVPGVIVYSIALCIIPSHK